MAECKEIDAALSRLSRKVDELNNRIKELDRKQKECCDKKQPDTKDNNLEGLIKRIAAIEKYINQLDVEIKLITDKIKEIGKFFGDLADITDSILGKVFGSISLFTNLFKFFK